MRPLFSDAPIIQQAQTLPAQPVGSQLAAALSRPTGMPNYGVPSAGIPLSTMMQLANRPGDPGTGSTVTSATPNLQWNPDNAVGTDTLGGGTANQGSVGQNWMSSLTQQQPPQAPVQGAFPGPMGMLQQPPPLGMMGQIYGGG